MIMRKSMQSSEIARNILNEEKENTHLYEYALIGRRRAALRKCRSLDRLTLDRY